MHPRALCVYNVTRLPLKWRPSHSLKSNWEGEDTKNSKQNKSWRTHWRCYLATESSTRVRTRDLAGFLDLMDILRSGSPDRNNKDILEMQDQRKWRLRIRHSWGLFLDQWRGGSGESLSVYWGNVGGKDWWPQRLRRRVLQQETESCWRFTSREWLKKCA